MTLLVVTVFVLVYVGMILGGLPFLELDRTGIALLGAIVLVATGAVAPAQAASAVHLPTLVLLFSFMVISAQMRLGGFYTRVTQWIAALPLGPAALLGAVTAAVGLLAAVFSNDIVCLAVAPVLTDICLRRRLDPVPFLLALACAANVGSAATLIGNPQNMLIGEVLQLPFDGYLAAALPPVACSLVATWGILAVQTRGAWHLPDDAGWSPADERRQPAFAAFDGWQSAKGLVVASALVWWFLHGAASREVAALAGAGVLLTSRKLHSHKMLGLVDWELLVLFVGLFVVNHAMAQTGIPTRVVGELGALGWDLAAAPTLFVSTFALSNLVSNVPAVMLLLPWASGPADGHLLALASTLAGNLFIVGSIANIIVVDAARRCGVVIDWRRHARSGIPVTLVTLAIAAGWLASRAG